MTSRFRAVTSESLRGGELSAHILLTSVGRAMVNGVCADVMDEQSRGRALNGAWHQLYLLNAARLGLSVDIITHHLPSTLTHQHFTVQRYNLPCYVTSFCSIFNRCVTQFR